jgi:uncharacterized protein YaaQ
MMILLIAIVQSEDVGRLSDQLIHAGYRFTRVNAGGGFLGSGSSVLLIGVAEERLSAVAALFAANCPTRQRMTNAAAWTGMVGGYAAGGMLPTEVTVGGAVVYGIPAERFIQLGGLPPPPGSKVEPSLPQAIDVAGGDNSTGGRGTKLVVAIVQKEYVDAVAARLMNAGHRLTRFDTAGGFLRRGSTTLLVGVPAFRLPDVLALIEEGCMLRSDNAAISASASAGMPVHAATVFVLDTSHFLRF